ncbi:MAG: NifB/NifX family molybdenum-iron cluster-binding protein [Candidatus Thermoplasmatota archaeon]|nr:NifB/NifX family molybdenum-iron cluster-binding protein [Candidatus Thermoplasmatota archaeon]
MGDRIKIACATDDEIHLTKDHFGSAKFYLIYELDKATKQVSFIEKIVNSSPEEKEHGDPKKARSVSSILKDAKVLLCCAMGKNVVRMRKKYCPVISRETNIKKALLLLKEKYDELAQETQRTPDENREIIRV